MYNYEKQDIQSNVEKLIKYESKARLGERKILSIFCLKIQRDYKPLMTSSPFQDSEYNTNGLKWVGDMSKITLSPGFSFGADSGGETESDDAADSDKEDETDSQEESRIR